MGVLPACMNVHHVYAAPMQARRGEYQIFWKWSYKWLLATMWMLSLGSLQEQQMLLSTGPSHYPAFVFVF